MKNALIIALLFLSSVVGATTYYIDPSGSNSNNGSGGAPWLTLAYACSRSVSGDIIHVNAGTYNEDSKCSLPLGVSIVGDGDASLIRTAYNAGEHNGTISLASAAGNPSNGNQSISYIKIDGGNNAGTTAINIEFRYNVSIHHCTIVNCSAYGIWIFNNNRSYPQAPSITYATGNNIHNCTFTSCEHRFEGQSGFSYNNNIHTNSTRDVKCLTSDWMKGFIIRDNIFTKVFSPTGWNFVFETWHYSDNSEIYNNTFHGNAALDISDVRRGNGSWGLKVYNNSFIVDAVGAYNENGGEILDFEGWGALQYLYVYNNHFKNCVAPIWLGAYNQANCVYPDGTHWALDHIYIYNNIAENSGCTTSDVPSIVWLWDNVVAGYSYNQVWDNIFVCNNTLVSTDDSNQNQNGMYITLQGTASNFHIDNNIIQGCSYYAILITHGNNFNNISLQKNLFYKNGKNAVYYETTPSNKTENNLTPSNPLFVSATDYRLQTGSPAIGQGITVAGLTTDFAGNLLKNPPSIGAYESGSAPPSPVVPVYQGSRVENATPSILDITYDLNLNGTVIPPVSSFNVLVNSVTRNVSAVTVSGKTVKLTLVSAVKYGDIIIVSYTKPANNPLLSIEGGSAASISSRSVINNLSLPAKDATPVKIVMTISPNHIHKVMNVLLSYSSVPSTALAPQMIRITDLYGNLFIERVLVTGVTNITIPLNLRSGIYIVLMLANGLEMASQKMIVY